MSRVWRQASRQVYRPRAYLEAGVKQGEAVEIAAKQIYVYSIKMNEASLEASLKVPGTMESKKQRI